jgi:hypothetical protein
MKRVSFAVTAILGFALAAGPAFAGAEAVRGTVKAVGADSITLDSMGATKVFKLDDTTNIIAKGGSTATRAAKVAGQAGPKIGDVLKVGDVVEVHYKDVGGAMHATDIRAGVSLPGPETPKVAAAKATASGKITGLAADSFTVMAAGQTHVFKVDGKTMIQGKGASTKSRELDRMGKAPVLSEFLKVGDEVSVDYHDVAGAKVASEVRVTGKTS